MTSINGRLGDRRLAEKMLNLSFETYWPHLEDQLTRLNEPSAVDILAHSYSDTAAALEHAKIQVQNAKNRLFQEIQIRELADFRVKLQRWQNKKIVLVDHNYDDFVEKVYASAQRNIFATCSESDLDSWTGRSGARLMTAHKKSPAKVSRVFVFEDREEISEVEMELMRTQAVEGIHVGLYVNNEDDRFFFPPDLSKDFIIVDDGLIIGKSQHRRNQAASEWVFDNSAEKDRFTGFRSRLDRGCVHEDDQLWQKIFSGTPMDKAD